MNQVLLCMARTHYCLAPDHYIIPVPFYTNTCIFCALNHLCVHPSASVCPHPFVCIHLSAPIRLHSFVCTHLYEPACVHPSVFTHGGKKQNRRGSDVQFFEARYGCSSALVGHFPPLFTHFVTPSPTACFAIELMLLGLQRAASK